MGRTSLPRLLALLEVTLFLGLLLAPGAWLLAGFDARETVRTLEKREPAAAPAALEWDDPKAWLEAAEAWFGDAFPPRAPLIAALNNVLWSVGESGHPQVIVGRERWLFLESTLQDHLRTRPISDARLRRLVRALRSRAQWMRKRGVLYVLALAPNKATVYPEHMSPYYPPGDDSAILDRMLGMLRAKQLFEIVDLRPPLRAAKNEARLYHRTDSHWNLRGALVAVEAVHERLRSFLRDFQVPDWSTFEVRDRARISGDLAVILGLADHFEEAVPFPTRGWTPKWKRYYVRGYEERPSGLQPRVFEQAPGKGTAIFLRDSFGNAMLPWLGRPFNRLVEVPRVIGQPELNDAILKRLVDRERPMVIIEEIVERSLLTALPQDPSVWEDP